MMCQAPVTFNADADQEPWLSVLYRMFAKEANNWAATPDKELMAYIARAVGYMLTGLARERACFLFYGTPSTGKGTIVETLLSMLGEDYAIVTPTAR